MLVGVYPGTHVCTLSIMTAKPDQATTDEDADGTPPQSIEQGGSSGLAADEVRLAWLPELDPVEVDPSLLRELALRTWL